ncbi:hypothetical protein ACLOJK_006819 [Asimina triloba]
MEHDTAFRIAWPMACASLTVVRSRWPTDAASLGICMEIRGQKCRSIARLSVADRPRRGSAMNGQMGFEWLLMSGLYGPGIASACHARTGLEGCMLLDLVAGLASSC